MTVRKARTEDAGAIADIYRGYVEETAISFEYEAPDAAAMAERMEEAIAYLVAEDDGGRITGFAYAHPFSARAAYRRSAEVTIYLDRNETGKGIGRKLYEALEDALRDTAVHNLYAIVMYPGSGSVEFHEKMGYRIAGRLTDCGEKFGRLWSVVYMEKMI